jgi:hypothetical protein
MAVLIAAVSAIVNSDEWSVRGRGVRGVVGRRARTTTVELEEVRKSGLEHDFWKKGAVDIYLTVDSNA